MKTKTKSIRGSSKTTKELDSRIDEIERLLKDGYSIAEISKKIEYGYASVYNAAYRNGLGKYISVKNTSRTRRKYFDGLNKFTRACLEEEYVNQKNNLYEIAKKYECSPTCVLSYMKKYEIKTRSKSDALSLLYEKRGEELREHARQLAYVGINGIHMKGRKRKDTWIEREFEKFCTKNCIPFAKQYQIDNDGHRYDFLIYENVLVELDGKYWHDTIKQKTLDSMHNDLAISRGYDIVRITDENIQKTKGKCFDRFLKNDR